jgi:hypothetical protein
MEAAHSIHFHKSKWFLTTKLYNKIDLMKLFRERAKKRKKSIICDPFLYYKDKCGQVKLLEVSGQRSVISDEHVSIDKSSNPTTNKRPSPVDPVVMEITTSHSWAEGSGWVHGSTREWACSQDVGTHNETDGYGSYGAEGSLLGVSSGCIDSVNQGKCDDDLHDDSFNGSYSSCNTVDGDCLLKPGNYIESQA